jgi:uncharacterized protein (UPF0548 family)
MVGASAATPLPVFVVWGHALTGLSTVGTVELLDPQRIARLRASRFTYTEVGQTVGDLPAGYRTFQHTTSLPTGTDFPTVTEELLHWQIQQRAGLHVTPSSKNVTPESVVVLAWSWLPIHAPCRVVYVINQPHRQGFAYGTLPGHPESGEEAFILDQREDGMVTFTVTAFSRPATTLARLAGPVGQHVQNLMTRRYLRALAP